LIKQYTKHIRYKLENGEDFEMIPRCPFFIYTCYIAKTHDTVQTEAMRKGNYFEYLCLGKNAKGKTIIDLPRKINGNKTIDQERIEQQSIRFLQLCQSYGIDVNNIPKQVYYKIPYDDDKCEIYLTGTTDFETPVLLPKQRNPTDCIVDLKLTQSLSKSFGDYNWNETGYMDLVQADMYTYLTKKQFLYWIFDYAPQPSDTIIIHQYSDYIESWLLERINKVIAELIFDMNNGWKAEGSYEVCKNCPHNPRNKGKCSDAVNMKTI